LRKNGNEIKQFFNYLLTSTKLLMREVLYNILIEFGIPMKLVRLIKMFMNETYSRVRVGKHLSDMFPVRNVLKQGDVFSPFLFNFAFEHAIRKLQVNQDGLKLYGRDQFWFMLTTLIYRGGSVRTTKKNTDVLGVASKNIGLEVHAI
jgi:hypothetical protein